MPTFGMFPSQVGDVLKAMASQYQIRMETTRQMDRIQLYQGLIVELLREANHLEGANDPKT